MTETTESKNVSVRRRPRNKRRSRLRAAVWLLIASCLLTTVVTSILWLTDDPQSLLHSTQVIDVRRWETPAEEAQYQWLTDTTLFMPGGSPRSSHPYIHDTVNHAATRLTALSTLLTRDGTKTPENWTESWDWKLSPDHRWFLWTGRKGKDVRIARLDGSGYQSVKVRPGPITVGKTQWKNGHEWVAECIGSRTKYDLTIFGGDTRKPGKQFDLPRSEEVQFLDKLVIDPGEGYAMVRTIDAFGDHRNTFLSSPTGTLIIDLAQSNDGKRLAWFVSAKRTKPLAEWIGKIWPAYAAEQSMIELWIGPSERNDLHRIAYLPVDASHDEASTPSALQWLPSDTKLSFIYKGVLRTFPVD